MPLDFCHLHCHSQYSLLDGASKIKDMIKRAQKLGQKAIAITDHGNMFGAVEFYKAASDFSKAAEKEGKPGVKPIIGMEAYIVPDAQSRLKREKVDGDYDNHCLLWAADTEGYQNLMKLASTAYVDGFYMHPRIDMDVLQKHSKGLIGSSGCLGSEIPSAILHKDYETARKLAGRYLDIFGKENFYFEVQNQAGLIAANNGNEEAQELARLQHKTNEAIIKICKEFGGKLIATNDSHYTDKSDAPAHDALLCIGTGKLLRDTNRLKFACDEFYIKSSEEMLQLFEDLPEALTNTCEIAERCNVKIKMGEYHYPIFKVPEGRESNEYFRELVIKGCKARYGDTLPDAVVARMEEELRVLIKMGFVGYLLIVWDIIREARARGIPVGPGRGSAAGSVACYALGITNIDPLKYALLFERFVNEGRNEMPDIDIDFCQSRRPEIISYVQDKYGRDCTAGIITFNSMAAKGSIRDLGRVKDMPLPEVDRIAKMIDGLNVTLQERTKEGGDVIHAVDDNPDFKADYENKPEVRELVDMARRIEGLARNPGRHAAGLVISDKPVTEYCPLYRDKDGALLTQYEMSHIDNVGLLKIDFLGLETLTVLTQCLKFIEERHGKKIDLDTISIEDPNVYQMLTRGEAKGIFQFESDGMVKMLTEARPDRLEDLIALNAMYRPGPLENIPSFINRKHGREVIDYKLADLEPILKDTYGIIVYQEQVMQIANQLAGFSLSDTDKFRKAMGKKVPEIMQKYREQFVAGCVKKGLDQKKVEALFDLIGEFAKYGFNKSHSAAYALVAYQTAWLKANYKAEFMAALLSLKQGNTDDVVTYIEESRRIGLKVEGPHINKSDITFGIEDDHTLRFSLGAVKGVGEKAVESIVSERKANGPFKDLYEFCERVDGRAANKGCLEGLIRGGAFDCFLGENLGGRGQLFAAVEESMARGASARQDRESGQGSLFGGDDDASANTAGKTRLPPGAHWNESKRLEEEKKVLGFYFSGHPLEDVREVVEGISTCSIGGLGEIPEGFEVVLAVWVSVVQNKLTRAKNERMAVLNVEDFSGKVAQVVVFPRTYEKYKELIIQDRPLVIRGRVKTNDGPGGGGGNGNGNGGGAPSGPPNILAEELISLDAAIERYARALRIILRNDIIEKELGPKLDSVANLLKAHPGRMPVWFQLDVKNETGTSALAYVKAGPTYGTNASPGLFQGLRVILPRNAVSLKTEGTAARRPPEPRWKKAAG